MQHTSAVAAEQMLTKDRIIIALDVETEDEARAIVEELGDSVGGYKIGLQLFSSSGPEFVRELTAAGRRIFLDLKFHDIPNTVANASIAAARMGVWMFNVHASGGSEMMRRAAEAVAECCEKDGIRKPLVIGVTVLTSSDDEVLRETGIPDPAGLQVSRLAGLASSAGLDGVVASSREVGTIREVVSQPEFLIVTPGIRTSSATNDDQKRVNTLGAALALGSDYAVIGRPVLESADRRRAVELMLAETATD